MREFIVAANWKLHKTPDEAVHFLRDFIPALSGHWPDWARTVLIFPPTLLCHTVAEHLRPAASHEAWVLWGGQNCYAENEGAFTGENSPRVLKVLGAHSVLVGHSERRVLFHETDELLACKIKAAQDAGLAPMLCVGEQLEARQSGKAWELLRRQLKFGLQKADFNKPLYLAYEPVWAIGTGLVATPAQAQEAHAFIRSQIAELATSAVAERLPILYGGSVKPDNAQGLADQAEIDGFLVGGASLDPRSFLQIATVLKKSC